MLPDINCFENRMNNGNAFYRVCGLLSFWWFHRNIPSGCCCCFFSRSTSSFYYERFFRFCCNLSIFLVLDSLLFRFLSSLSLSFSLSLIFTIKLFLCMLVRAVWCKRQSLPFIRFYYKRLLLTRAHNFRCASTAKTLSQSRFAARQIQHLINIRSL